MGQSVTAQARRFMEQARVKRVGAPSYTTAYHLRFFARAQVLEKHYVGNDGRSKRVSQSEIQDALAIEYGYSQNPTGEHGLKSTRRSVRRALGRSEQYLTNRLCWGGDRIIAAGDGLWCVIFVRGFNPFFPGDYEYTPMGEKTRFDLAPPATWFVVFHWEYMEPTVNPKNPAEVGIRRCVEETVECRPFFFSLPGISVP